jgi:hypothetical protein
MVRKKSETAKHGAAGHEPGHTDHAEDATDRADTLRKQPASRSRRGARKTVKALSQSHEGEHEQGHEHDQDHKPAQNDAAPETYGVFGRLVYRATYAVTYGVVFPVMLLAHAVPMDNAVVQGFLDGAGAAREAAESMWGTSTAPALEAPGHEPGREHTPALQPA